MLHQISKLKAFIVACIVTGLLPGTSPTAHAADTTVLSNTVAAPTAATVTAPAPATLTGEAALAQLLAGNARYVADQAVHPDQTKERREVLAKGQDPVAIVLTCSDSRVAPELVFDQGLGDLFVIRNAGNVLDDHVIGSMEYGVEHLHIPLIIVMGHEKCGAVTAAVGGGAVTGHVRSLVESISPAIEQAKGLPGDNVDNVVRANAVWAASTLTHVEPILKEAAGTGKLLIVAARYDLDSGKVEVLQKMDRPASAP